VTRARAGRRNEPIIVGRCHGAVYVAALKSRQRRRDLRVCARARTRGALRRVADARENKSRVSPHGFRRRVRSSCARRASTSPM
jgi:hypothetical protein